MLIRTAITGYQREPDFEVNPPHVATMEERIAYALLNRPGFRASCPKENVDLRPAKRIVAALDKKQERWRKKQKQKERRDGSRL
jgi:coenzyme A diphosphatase NUDT7